MIDKSVDVMEQLEKVEKMSEDEVLAYIKELEEGVEQIVSVNSVDLMKLAVDSRRLRGLEIWGETGIMVDESEIQEEAREIVTSFVEADQSRAMLAQACMSRLEIIGIKGE